MLNNTEDKLLDMSFNVFTNVEDAIAAIRVAQRQLYECDKFMAHDTLQTALTALRDARLIVAPHVEEYEEAEAAHRNNKP